MSICMIMQVKRKKKKEKNRQCTLLNVLVYKDSQFNTALNLLLIYMYGLTYLQFNRRALPHLHVSNPGGPC